jgi:hypothetical protein
MKQEASRALVASCFILVTMLTLWPWRWRAHIPLKCWLTVTRLHGIILQKTELYIVTAVQTSIHYIFLKGHNQTVHLYHFLYNTEDSSSLADKVLYWLSVNKMFIQKHCIFNLESLIAFLCTVIRTQFRIWRQGEREYILCDLRFSQWWLLRLLSSGIWYYTVWKTGTSILKKPTTSIFRVKGWLYSEDRQPYITWT